MFLHLVPKIYKYSGNIHNDDNSQKKIREIKGFLAPEAFPRWIGSSWEERVEVFGFSLQALLRVRGKSSSNVL